MLELSNLMFSEWQQHQWWLVPVIAGCLLTTMTGPLGSFIVWRRMAFFGDTLAHGALLGITLSVLMHVDMTIALVVTCLLLALVLLPLQRQAVSSDTALGIVSHGTLALGLVALSLSDSPRVDLLGYLFGDLLAIDTAQLLTIAAIACPILIILRWQWTALVAVTVSAELAEIEGRPVNRLNLLLLVLLAATVAMAIQIVGVLLMSALLIVPAAAARRWSSSPKGMAQLAIAIGTASILLGTLLSFYADSSTGPTIVVVAVIFFVVSLFRRLAR